MATLSRLGTEEESIPPKSHQQYTDEQKQQAIRIALESDKSVSQVAQDPGIRQTALCRSLRIP
ncbi:transposase [Gloeobacter kilaueensis]|uniref:transposase n=1 Tax=Gloeobacter kilaueensis TaxID=1416614 RepID=UPI0008FFD7B1